MTRDEVATKLREQCGRRVRIIFDDNVTQLVDVASVDDEGFVHSGPAGLEPAAYWTRFEGIVSVEPTR